MLILFLPTPTPTPVAFTGKQVTDVIDAIDRTASTFQDFTIGLAALFVIAIFGIAIIAYFYFNRNASKGAQEMMTTFATTMGGTIKERDERIEALEKRDEKRDAQYIESLSAIGAGLNRLADISEHQRKNEEHRDRILSDATSAISTIVTVGSKPLQQVAQDVSKSQQQIGELQAAVSRLYDRFMLVFPTEKPNIEIVREVLIETVNKVCEQKKHDTGEIVPLKDEPPADGELKDAAA